MKDIEVAKLEAQLALPEIPEVYIFMDEEIKELEKLAEADEENN